MIRPDRPAGTVDVSRHYDELDRYYRELWGEDLHHGLWTGSESDPRDAAARLTELVAERAEIGSGDEVCDVGCGYGGTARFLGERLGARVVGLTVSEAQHRHAVAASEGDPRLRFLHRDWRDHPFPAERFDAVLAVESASHMDDKPGFHEECRRVLRPGGRLVVAAWMASERPAAWEERHLLRPICEEGRLPGLASESEYRGWLGAAGLKLLSFEDLSRDVRRTWTVSIRRLCGRVLTDPDARRYVLDPTKTERRFALTLLRIWTGYRTGALRYGLFAAEASSGPPVVNRLAPSPS